ncbi:MAG: hypothetical protein JWN50_732 [Parcubacteria group bacterium]|nr:hypothetical protein [Parcubacteria group bacterium]
MLVPLSGISSNQLYEYFEEVIALYREMKDDPGEADVDAAA